MTPIRRLTTRLKALRDTRGWSQEELAKRAGISRGYLARLETGRHDPTLTIIEKLAKALGVRVTKLLD